MNSLNLPDPKKIMEAVPANQGCGFVGSGLVFAGISNTCALAMLLAKLPYNQPHQ